MRVLAERLIPYSYPRVDTFEEEQEILLLKQRNLTMDGYEFIACFSCADYDSYIQESLQIQPCCVPFLPFTTVCKIGKMFMGSKHLSYVEFFKDSKKIYCWTLKRSHEGRILAPGKRTKPANYEGFDYCVLHPGTVDLH